MTSSSPAPAPAASGPRVSAPGTRISSCCSPTTSFKRLGVEVIFGLCGHRRFGSTRCRRARSASSRPATSRWPPTRPMATRARRASPGRAVTPRSGPDQRRHRRGQRRARFDPDGGDRGDVPSYPPRPPPAPGSQPASGRRPVEHLPAVLQARLPYWVDRVEDLPRVMERAFHLCQTGRPVRAGRRADGFLLGGSRRRRVREDAAADCEETGLDPATAARIVDALANASRPAPRRAAGCSRRAPLPS